MPKFYINGNIHSSDVFFDEMYKSIDEYVKSQNDGAGKCIAFKVGVMKVAYKNLVLTGRYLGKGKVFEVKQPKGK